MRVLVVSSYPPRHCGIGAYARDQVARLRAEGHEVMVLSPPDGGGDLRAPFLGGGAFRLAARLAPRFDSVIVHVQPALYYRPRAAASKVLTSLSLLRLAAAPNLELLVHEADEPARWRPDYRLLAMALRRAAKVSFHTAAEREALERAYGVRVRGSLVEHRVSPAGEGPGRDGARRALGLEPRGPLFVCAGFLQPSKGFDRVLPAFDGAGDAELVVVGSIRERTPDNEAHLRALREACASRPRVRLVERFVDDAEFDRWVAAADWLVLPYRRSWSSGVLARAHALGTPSILTDVGGLGEQAGEGDVVVANDDEELVAALRAAAARRRAVSG